MKMKKKITWIRHRVINLGLDMDTNIVNIKSVTV